MSITSEGVEYLNFVGVNGVNDALFGGGAVFHFGSGQIDEVNKLLGNELFTVPATLKQVNKANTTDGKTVSDVSIIVCDITADIGTSEITEVGLSVDGVIVALDNLNLNDENQFTLTKKDNGSTYVEWALLRTRSNEPVLLHTGPDFTLWMNPLVSNTNVNQGLLSKIRNIVLRKNAESVLEAFTAAGSHSLVTDSNGDLLLSVDLSLMPAAALQGGFPYNTLKEIHIGASSVDEPGLFSVYWDPVKTRTSEQTFKIAFSQIIKVETSQ